MPNRQFVRICPLNSTDGVDLEVPADEPICSFLPDLLKVMDLPSAVNGKQLKYALRTEVEELLDEGRSLREVGIENFQTLWLATVIGNPNEGLNNPENKINNKETTLSLIKESPTPSKLPNGLQGEMSTLFWAQVPIEHPSLVSPTGIIFELGSPPITIGRFSKDFTPSIDLTELDKNMISSRRHAEINIANGKYILKALKTTNGLYVNGVKLDAYDTTVLRDGDTIRFGQGEVKLVFCMPKK
jgi:hypothetical protein